MASQGRTHYMTIDSTERGTMSEAPELLTITEAAEFVRVPVATMRYWRWAGTGPRSFRLGRRVVYQRQDILNWIDEQARQATAG